MIQEGTHKTIAVLNNKLKDLDNKIQHFHNILWNLDDVDYLKEEYEQLFNLDKDGKAKR